MRSLPFAIRFRGSLRNFRGAFCLFSITYTMLRPATCGAGPDRGVGRRFGARKTTEADDNTADAILGFRTVLRAAIILAGAVLAGAGLWAQRPFREVAGAEYDKLPLPKDYREQSEWVFARLMYPPVGRYYGGF